MMDKKILNKSIAELEGYNWQGIIPTEDSSFLEKRFYQLHHCKLKQLTVKDVDLYIEQEYGLKYVVPLALKILEENIFTETDYEGALLFNILTIEKGYWSEYPEIKKKIITLFNENQKAFKDLDTTQDIKNDIQEAYKEFVVN